MEGEAANQAPMLVKGQRVWTSGSLEWVWEQAEVEEVVSRDEYLVLTQSKRLVLTNLAFPANANPKGGYDDMTSMMYINEPAILSNLHRRAVEDLPYTFMGPVMVAVNPLKVIDSGLKAGSPKVTQKPHPFAVAEMAYKQLQFACNQVKRGVESDTPVSQTVVVGGESGAGKTESSKMVLNHLVVRSGGGSLDKKLLGNNAILESFGNAQTLRNSNSSRFGKLLKLHFDADGASIVGASISTYLLERSRVTSHEYGERGYHVFYHILSGMHKDKELGISPKSSYAYLTPGGTYSEKEKPEMRPKSDLAEFEELSKALKDIGMHKADIALLFKAVAGVLHIGNIEFVNDDRPEGFVASVKKTEAAQDALEYAASTLGFSKTVDFVKLFSERKIKSGGSKEPITAYNDAKAAKEARDAVARTLYSRIFNFVLARINESIDNGNTKDDQPKIGVLDIFGFESFQHNDFEQLLINYTNESLQATFNEQVFHAEAELYKREQLSISSSSKMPAPKGNLECMTLLEGGSKKNVGVLDLITQEAQNPGANDLKFNDKLHKTFRNKNKSFGKVHPKNIATNFVIVHYAGSVTYTVGSFLAKNADAMPKEVDAFFATSQHPLMAEIWSSTEVGTNASKSKKQGSIVAKFKTSIMNLKDYLNSTRCSFIRCVKPNALMERNGNDRDWFDRRYVTNQLKALSVLQTAEVLKDGLPTRITYAELTDSYSTILPNEALDAWRGIGGGSVTAFVAALFWAFGVPRSSYKLGVTRVFFASGMLSELESILGAASKWGEGKGGKEKEEVLGRFRRYFAHRRWRVAFVKAIAVIKFKKMLAKTTDRSYAAARLQHWFHGAMLYQRHKRLRKAAVIIQKYSRKKLARKIYKKKVRENLKKLEAEEREKKARRDQAERERKEAEAEAERLRQERLRKEEEIRQAEERKLEAEKKMKELKSREKKLGSMKSMNDRLMAKRRRQLAHLEESGNSLETPYDKGSAKEEEYNKIQEEKEAEARIIAETDAEQDLLAKELDEAKARESELNKHVEELVREAELAKSDYDLIFKRWRKNRSILDNKRQKQIEALDHANDSFGGTMTMNDYFRRVEAERKGVKSESKAVGISLAKLKQKAKNQMLRPSQKHATIPLLEDDDELSSDDEYAIRPENEQVQILRARGSKLPIKQGKFRLFNRWKHREFVLRPDTKEIRWYQVGKNVKRNVAGEESGTFVLNHPTSQYPPSVTENPPKYSRKNVLLIQNGYLKQEHASLAKDAKTRALVIAFDTPRDMEDWSKALGFNKNAKKGGIMEKLRNSLGRGKDDDDAIVAESFFNKHQSLSDDDVLENEELEKDAQAWSKRWKLMNKLKIYSQEKIQNVLVNSNFVTWDDPDVPVADATIVVFCPHCKTKNSIAAGIEDCPACGERIGKTHSS